MRVFITGATGFIGSAVAKAYSRAGHQVFGMARSKEKGRQLAVHEIEPVYGSLDHPEAFTKVVSGCHVLVHCALEDSPDKMQIDRMFIESLIDTARKSGHPTLLVYTSGVWVYGDTGSGTADEASSLNPPESTVGRMHNEKIVLAANKDQLRTIVLRPGCVYGGSGSLTASWFESAVKEGAAQIVGDGQFRWALVHLEDLADLYLRAGESPYGGEIFNATDRSRFTIYECAQAASIAAGAGGKVTSISVDEAVKAMGPWAACLVLNQHIDSSKAVRLLRWQPRHGGFVDGVDRYFVSWKASAGL